MQPSLFDFFDEDDGQAPAEPEVVPAANANDDFDIALLRRVKELQEIIDAHKDYVPMQEGFDDTADMLRVARIQIKTIKQRKNICNQ